MASPGGFEDRGVPLVFRVGRNSRGQLAISLPAQILGPDADARLVLTKDA